MKIVSVFRLLAILFLLFSLNAAAIEKEVEEGKELEKEQESDTKVLRRITVAAENPNEVPGSAHYLNPEKLEEAKKGFDDVHRVLRQVPGVNIQEEEGFGLRPNIGMRGTSVERSANITLMEDSVLIAPAPYSAPSAYFFPPIGRMESVEVLKGPGQIKYGPRTVGGSLNMFSTSIPDKLRARAKIQAGEYDSKLAHINVGNNYKYGGWLFETYQSENDGFKNLDSGGDTGFDIEDYTGKFRLNTDPNKEYYQELEIKLNDYNQESRETYLGLTQSDFDADPFRRYAGSQLDNIEVNHSQYQARHYIELGKKTDLTTTFYRNDTDRNWFKLESVDGERVSSILREPNDFAEQLAWIQGADSPEDTFALRHNNRDYYSQGIQTVFGKEFEVGKTSHDLEFSVRYHEDEEDRFQREDLYQMVNGKLVLNTIGDPGSNANRISDAEAWAFSLQDKIKYEDFIFTPGVRFESISLTRRDFGKEDPTRSGSDLSETSNSLNEVMPGMGTYYHLNDNVGLFAGVHKGFSPPTPSSNNEVEEEESINYEAGVNVREGAFDSEVVLFYNDYDNLLGADTVSSGGEGTGDLFNGGAASVWGTEASMTYDLGEHISEAVTVPVRFAYTYTSAEFDDSFDSDFFGLVSSGDSIPYVPENQLSLGIGLGMEGWFASFDGHYVDAMPTVAGQAGTVSTEKTDSYFVFDLNGEVEIMKNVKLFATVQNIFDEEYAVARRPAGARPGLPRTFLAGLTFDLG